ncbi:hypothetical protein JCM33374_g165 [Metschnikowia sp. JCM 33374]|nr:hypothetical protein JCM33374_g165 [Metschnikowia sp. JCM 33374]
MLNFIGSLLLLHAAYSSYEHHQLVEPTSSVPHDIILEIILGLLALNFGTIQNLRNTERVSLMKGEKVQPTEKYLEPIKLSQAMLTLNNLGVSEYEDLECRVDFMDIRQKRKDHLNYTVTDKK